MIKLWHFILGIFISVFGTLILTLNLFIIPTHEQFQEAYNTCPETMYCYEPYGAPVEAEHVMQGAIVQVNFLPAGHQDLHGSEAIATWVVDYDNNVSWCVINTQFPEQVLGDPRMDALGHELLHCIIGEFHP